MLIFKLVKQHVTMEEPSSYNGDPISMALLAAGASAAQVVSTNKAAQASAEAAVSKTRMDYNLQEAQRQEIAAQAGMELSQEQMKRVVERGKVRAAQAESGVAGASSVRQLADTYMQESFTKGSIISKEEANLYTSSLQTQASYLQGANAVNEAKNSMYTPLSALLTIGGSAAASYATAGGLKAAGGTGVSGVSGTVGAQTGAAKQQIIDEIRKFGLA